MYCNVPYECVDFISFALSDKNKTDHEISEAIIVKKQNSYNSVACKTGEYI
jgi:hypothetical protein